MSNSADRQSDSPADRRSDSPADTPSAAPAAAPSAAPSDSASSGRRVYVLLLLAAAAALLFVNSRNFRSRQGASHPAVGQLSPALRLEPCAFVDSPLSPAAAEGRVVLVNFWGTWCPPCREEFPHLAALRQRFASNERFLFVSVSCEMSEDPADFQRLPEETRRYLQAERMTFPVYCDPADRFRRALLGVLRQEDFAYPTTVVVGTDGRIRGVWRGYRSGDERDMANLVEQSLAAS